MRASSPERQTQERDPQPALGFAQGIEAVRPELSPAVRDLDLRPGDGLQLGSRSRQDLAEGTDVFVDGLRRSRSEAESSGGAGQAAPRALGRDLTTRPTAPRHERQHENPR